MERKNSSEGGEKESGNGGDLVDIVMRKVIHEFLEKINQKRPNLFLFKEVEESEILESVKRYLAERKERTSKMEGSSSSSSNNNKVGDELQDQQPHEPDDAVLPMAFQEKIKELKGEEEKLLTEKKLSVRDLKTLRENSRFEFSVQQSKIANKFLTQEEVFWLEKMKSNIGMVVSVLDPSVTMYDMILEKSYDNKNSNLYKLSIGWNFIVFHNHLKLHDTLQLWSFRVSSKLCFAVIKL